MDANYRSLTETSNTESDNYNKRLAWAKGVEAFDPAAPSTEKWGSVRGHASR